MGGSCRVPRRTSMALRGGGGSEPFVAGQAEREVVDNGGRRGPVGLELAALLTQRDREAAQLAAADSLGAAGLQG